MCTDPTLPLCLSVRQPWAWLIVNGHKDIENRSWHTSRRGRILIHAGQRFEQAGYERVVRHMGIALPDKADLGRGGIVGVVEIVDVVEQASSQWFEGPYGFVLANPRPLTFVPARGRLSFFRLTDVPAEQVAQLLQELESAG